MGSFFPTFEGRNPLPSVVHFSLLLINLFVVSDLKNG